MRGVESTQCKAKQGNVTGNPWGLASQPHMQGKCSICRSLPFSKHLQLSLSLPCLYSPLETSIDSCLPIPRPKRPASTAGSLAMAMRSSQILHGFDLVQHPLVGLRMSLKVLTSACFLPIEQPGWRGHVLDASLTQYLHSNNALLSTRAVQHPPRH